MHQHVQTRAFLEGDGVRDLLAQKLVISVGAQAIVAMICAHFAHFVGLWKRSDGGGGQRRQRMLFLLGGVTLWVGTLALCVFGVELRGSLPEILASTARCSTSFFQPFSMYARICMLCP